MSTARNYMRNRIDRRPQRKAENEARVEAWQAMTPQKQLAELDARLGKGVGAKKQRARLNLLLREDS